MYEVGRAMPPVIVNSAISNNIFYQPTIAGIDFDFVTGPHSLHLKTDSPAVGAGTHINAPASDYDGAIRGNPPCIGAYEGVGLSK
jgi:hypothetical protein